MKYINREYGFNGRPPFFKDFYEETEKGPSVSGANYPQKPVVGTGLDRSAPNGAVLVGKHGTEWGVRVCYLKNGNQIDGSTFIHDKGKTYAVSPSGNFAYFTHGDITATFVNYSENAMVISVSTLSDAIVRIVYYPVAPSEGVFKANEKCVKGSAPYHAVIKGKSQVSEEGCVFKGRYDVYSDNNAKTRECFIAHTYSDPESVTTEGDSVVCQYHLAHKKNSRLIIFAEVGEKDIFSAEPPTEDELIAGISTAEIQYTSEKTTGSGVLCGNVESAVRSVTWHRIYNPYFLSNTYCTSRLDCDEFFSFTGYKMNAAVLTGALLGDLNAAVNSLSYAVEDRLLAVLTAWITLSRSRDVEMLKKVYPLYKTAFPPESDLVVANWKNKAFVAYKMEGSPLKEYNVKQNVYALDTSCMALVTDEILERMALALGVTEDAKAYANAKSSLKRKINETLYNETLGIYMNRYVDGDFAASFGITSFYPLLAGVFESEERLSRTLSCLTNPKKFWGETVVPTLAKDNPEYGSKKAKDLLTDKEYAQYDGYHGSVSCFMNYLVYLGLVRNGVDDVASELAIKCGKLYKKLIHDFGSVTDIVLPNGKIAESACRDSVEGNLLAAMGACELLDVEYFRNDTRFALRFGTKTKGEHSIANVRIAGHKMSLTVKDTITYLIVDDKEAFTGEGGRFAVRNFVEDDDCCEFFIDANSIVKITANLPIIAANSELTKVVLTVEKGKSKVHISGSTVTVEKIM